MLAVVILESCGSFRSRLPLGGGQIQQLGIMFAEDLAKVFIEDYVKIRELKSLAKY